MNHWSEVGQTAAVLEVRDEQWRFTHDKLREAVEREVPLADRPALHRRIAEALETTYPNDTTRAETLLRHWQAAGDEAKELHYLEVVAYWLNQFGIDAVRARHYCSNTVLNWPRSLPDADRLRMRLLKRLADVCDRLGELAAAKEYGDSKPDLGPSS